MFLIGHDKHSNGIFESQLINIKHTIVEALFLKKLVAVLKSNLASADPAYARTF